MKPSPLGLALQEESQISPQNSVLNRTSETEKPMKTNRNQCEGKTKKYFMLSN